jgi:hypothetical protein
MVPTDIPNPDAPEFAPIRGELARLFIEHRDDLGLMVESDDWIVEHVGLITIALIRLTTHALDHGDEAWLARHAWWREASRRLFKGEAATRHDRAGRCGGGARHPPPPGVTPGAALAQSAVAS